MSSIAAPIRPSARVRLLARDLKLTAEDIVKLTGYRPSLVRSAQGKGEAHNMPKSRAR